MGTIVKPNTFSPSTTASSSQVNDNFDTIYNEFNGNIAAANLASGAVTTTKIADSNVTTAKIADSNVTTAKIASLAVTDAKIDFSTFMQTERRLPAANTTSGYSVAALGSAISGSTYGSGIFTMATNGSITIVKKCIITINWSAYMNGSGSAGYMWIINKNNSDISIAANHIQGTGYSGTTDFRWNSVSVQLLAEPGDIFRVGYYKSNTADTDTTRNGCSVTAIAVN